MSEFVIARSTSGADLDGVERRLPRLRELLVAEGSELVIDAHRSESVLVASLSTSGGERSLQRLLDDLFRCTGARLITDGECTIEMPRVAGRTLWRARTGDADIVSTSMRAIVFCLGDLDPDPEAAVWMLVTGSLGPDRSWDRRCRQLIASHRYTLGSAASELRPPPPGDFVGASPGDLTAELERRIALAVASFGFDPAEWALPLSGGVDSRALALAVEGSMPMFTYGDLGTLTDPGSDLSVARRVAAHLAGEHREIELGSSDVDPTTVLERFVAASDARTDQVAGYADGMQLWIDLRSAGVRGVIRGDEVFGWVRRLDAPSSRVSTGALVPGDLRLPASVRASFSELSQHHAPPAWIVQSVGESVEDYRDRLYRGFRVPSMLAPLTQTKSAYVDVASPFLADEVVELMVQVPGRLRTDKRLFRRSVIRRSAGIPFAERASIRPAGSFVDGPEARELLCRTIAAAPDLPGVPDAVRDLVAVPSDSGGDAGGRNPALVAAVRNHLPLVVRREVALRSKRGPVTVSLQQLRFRTALVASARAMLDDVAAAGRMSGPGPAAVE